MVNRDKWIRDEFGIEYEIIRLKNSGEIETRDDYSFDSGAEGAIYKVRDKSGQIWAFKSIIDYSRCKQKLVKVREFYDHNHGVFDDIESNFNGIFTWPVSFVEEGFTLLNKPIHGGYIMKYIDMKGSITCEENREGEALEFDCKTLCDISMKLCRTIASFHDYKHCYNDISRDNIRFDCKSDFINDGRIIVVDLDNVGLEGSLATIEGTVGFSAPEMRTATTMSIKSDLFSIAVILFHLWMKGDPFEGTADVIDWDTYKSRSPVFVFHPLDKSNTLIGNPESLENFYWEGIPKEIKECFINSLGYGVENPDKRVSMKDWIAAFSNVKYNGLKRCPSCGKMMAKEGKHCIACGKDNDKLLNNSNTPIRVTATDFFGNPVGHWDIKESSYIPGEFISPSLKRYEKVISIQYGSLDGSDDIFVVNRTDKNLEILMMYGDKTRVLPPNNKARVRFVRKLFVDNNTTIIFDTV